MPRPRRGIAEDLRVFWSCVDNTPTEKGCWFWNGKVDPKGYGYTQYDGKRWTTHRLSYLLRHGKIPKGREILHTCDTPNCVQPLHLWPGTQQDNIADMDAKGRRGTVKGRFVGEKHPFAKLTDAQVLEIRARYQAGGIMQKDLAEEYGVVPSAISHLIRGRRDGLPSIRRTARENSAAIRGEQHHEGKLTEEAVRRIRQRYGVGGVHMKELAEAEHVTKQMVWRIVHGKAWAWLELLHAI